MAITFILNGRETAVDVEPEMPLLWVLRDVLNLTGTKFACGIGACGACTVQLNGQAARSCVLPVSAVTGAEVTTIEGLAEYDGLNPLQLAWIEHQVPQCGYCQSGLLMAVSALLNKNPAADTEELRQAVTNICRCGSYEAVKRAVQSLTEKAEAADA